MVNAPAAWLSLALLGAAAAPEPKKVGLGTTFELKAGESAEVAAVRLTVTFERVTEDSRCPLKVQCVSEGDATAEVSLAKPPAAKATRTLHTSGRFPQETTYEGLKVRLEDLTPYPKDGVATEPRAYRVSLVVEKALP